VRFLVIVKANADSEAGIGPSGDELATMARFNDQLFAEGRIVFAEGLTPSSDGVRVLFEGAAEPKVIDGPFAETKELIAGVWLLNGESLEDVVELMKHAPCFDAPSGVLEIRPIDG
jgi:hypothetical protein